MSYRLCSALSGYGKSDSIRGENVADFLDDFVKAEGLQRVVVVSPSYSGQYSLPFLMDNDPNACTRKVRGFVPVAPSGTFAYSSDWYQTCRVSYH